MMISFLSAALMLSASANALPRIAPTPKSPTCFKRQYTEEELRLNPLQKLEAMIVKVSYRTESSESGPWTWMPAEVVGTSHGEAYGNTAACTLNQDSTLSCAVECDGGSFRLRHSPRYPEAVNFVVTKDYFFPLFKNQMGEDPDHEIEKIPLRDEPNRIYRLLPVDVRECDEVIERVGQRRFAGC